MNFKFFKSLLLRSIFPIGVILWTKSVSYGLCYQKLILWNTGYSQFQTLVTEHSCLHMDPGGTLRFPKQHIYKLCRGLKNRVVYLHNDRYHTNFINSLTSMDDKLKDKIESIQELGVLTNQISENHTLISPSHFDRQDFKFKLEPQIRDKKREYQSLILPNHGQTKYLNRNNVLKMTKYLMLISGSQSRTYEAHKSTEKKFTRIKKPLVLKTQWGHLIFERQKSEVKKINRDRDDIPYPNPLRLVHRSHNRYKH